MKEKLIYSPLEMQKMSLELLEERDVTIRDLATVAWNEAKKTNLGLSFDRALEEVLKTLSLRDIFHGIMIAVNLDKLAQDNLLTEPLLEIIKSNHNLFNLNKSLGLECANLKGINSSILYGDLIKNKPGIIYTLSVSAKVNTMLIPMVSAIIACASTSLSENLKEEALMEETSGKKISIFDLEK